MNGILTNGYVAPYICFNFANGSISDYLIGKHFISLRQTRDVDQGVTFDLELVYVPGYDGESVAQNIHQLLLSSVNKPVTYQYGYIKPNGEIITQDQVYKGIFIQYKEDLQPGYMSYTISGVACAIQKWSQEVSVEEYLKQYGSDMEQPSVIVDKLCNTETGTKINEYMSHYEKTIQKVDNKVYLKTLQNITNGTLLSIFAGSRNADKSKIVGGFVYYSYKDLDIQYDQMFIGNPLARSAYENSSYYRNNIKNKQPFVCFFDNIVYGHNSNMDGTFYYGPLKNDVITDNFVYEYGNSFLHSDVISFNVSTDCTVAMATAAGLSKASVGITQGNGETAGTTYNIIKDASELAPKIYATPSGFDEANWLTMSALAKSLNFPFEATMTVIGQTRCNHLLDRIHVDVIMNGVVHPVATGNYTILGIEDNLSDGGFTTTFRLLKESDSDQSPKDALSAAKEQISQWEIPITSLDYVEG